MKNIIPALLFLTILLPFSSCKKDDAVTSQLVKVTMTNGEVIYASPTDNSTSVEWGGFGTNTTALTDITSLAAANMDFSGEANTATIVAQLETNNDKAYAAKLCADLVAYGFDDWYLPAAGELNELYKKLGPTNNGFGGSGQMPSGAYWSSSESGNDVAWAQRFDDGTQLGVNVKYAKYRCRCARR